MEFLNLIMNGFAYIFSTIEKKVEIYLLMESSSTVSSGCDGCRRVGEEERRWEQNPFLLWNMPSSLQIHSGGVLTLISIPFCYAAQFR